MVNNPFHPGVFLDELLQEYEITPYRLAKSTFVAQTRIGEIISGKRSITPDTALRFSRFFGNSASYWMNLQTSYDLSQCKVDRLGEIEPLQTEAQ